ncbi:MAG TPA: OmpH family outer membrane protein [Acidobacteriaceae bacterium]|nr:OmpH family outer membrane protein [Acidobacteriaceae bacterium]
MKRSLFVVAALAATFTVGAGAQTSQPPSAPTPASAAVAPTGATKIAVIAFQPAVAATNEGRAAFAKIQQRFQPKQTELKGLSDQIDALKKQLQADGSTLSPDERADRLRVIDDKEKSLQREAQDAQSDFQQAMSEAYQGIAQKFYAVLQDYCKANGYGAVFDMSTQQTPVVWASKAADISEAVVQEYNQKSGVPAPASTSTAPAATHHRTTPAAH